MQQAIKDSNARFIVEVLHRRYGKTVGAADWLCDQIHHCTLPRPRGFFVFPFATQAEDVIWDQFEEIGDPYGAKFYRGKLEIKFKNGGLVKLVGAERYYKHRGKYADAVAFDETPFIPPAAWRTVFRPMLADRGGKACFLGTPNGRDWFHDLYQDAASLPGWERFLCTVWESGVLPLEEIEALQREMKPHEFAREMECDWDQPGPGAFFEREMNAARAHDRIGVVPHNPRYPVTCAWYMTDSGTIAVTFWQKIGANLHAINAQRWLQDPLTDVVAEVMEQPYVYNQHFCGGKLVDDSERMKTMRALGLERVRVGTQLPTGEAIHKAQTKLHNMLFDAENCMDLVDAARHFHAEYHDRSDVFGPPVRDWTEEYCQSLMLMLATHSDKRSDWSQPIDYRTRVA